MTPGSSGLVERLLAERIGLDVASVGDGLIERGVRRRVEALGLAGWAEYERALPGSGKELQALIEEIVIPESWFFRDDRPFAVLREHVKANWVADPGRPAFSALSLPCAGGEEPYSIALAMLELGLDRARFRVDAADVSVRSLGRAMTGVYGANSFRGTPSTIRDRYFREQGGRFAIDPAVRSTVHFHEGNVLDPALFRERPPFDVVFCRNLLIYFDGPSRARAFATLGRLVVDGGLLFLGHADRGDDSPGSPFAPLADKGSFAYRKGPPRPSSAPKAVEAPRMATRPTRPIVPPGPTTAGPAAAARPVPPPTPPPPPAGEPAPGASLGAASSLADRGRYDEATRMAGRAMAEGGATAAGHFLLGMIRQAAGDRDGAEAHLLKAVYLDANHDEALLALALLARRKGDVAGEAAYRRRAARVLARKERP